MSNLETLTNLKLSKLAEQKELSDKMSHILKSEMIPSQTMNNKNLIVAIAVSKKAGFFEYYQAPDQVKEFERDKILSKLTRSIGKLNSEIDSITGEISLAMQEKKASIVATNAKLMDTSRGGPRSISQWMEAHASKDDKEGAGKMDSDKADTNFTSFKPASKIYGGTAHHRSFKSSASTMTLGRMI